ncbi:MAG: phosphodiester glycosidase family protein [Caldilineales bacterium]|nr:phosphodiester glycosidase family protein [Caldilineales bacterium]
MRAWFLLPVWVVLAACVAVPPAPTPATIPKPNSPPAAAAATTPTRPSYDRWQPLFPGAELMMTSDGLAALRHTATAVRFGVHFEPIPAQGRSVGEWLGADEQAWAAVNCGFYWDNAGVYAHLGLLVTADEVIGRLRRDWGGVLIVHEGAAAVVARPRRVAVPAELGLQGWPMLVSAGRVWDGLDAQAVHRRTAVGVDGAGRVVWVAAPYGRTLAALAERLLAPDLGLVEAVNLDGGVSTGLRWRAGPQAPQQGPDSLPIPCAVLLTPNGM